MGGMKVLITNFRLAARTGTELYVRDLAAVASTPDVIHGQQKRETMVAMLHFPEAPAVYFCHD